MATFSGNHYGERQEIDLPTNPDFGHRIENVPDLFKAAHEAYGALSDTQPITAEPANAQTGGHAYFFGLLDFYNHIHLSELTIDLGNVVSVQQRELLVFNGYFVPRTLNDVVPTNDEGLTLTEPGATPLVFAPLQELSYLISIATDGPATIDADYLFDFDVRDFNVHVVGVRIVAWSWEANWLNPVIERLEWKTRIIEAYDGSEQRAQLRGYAKASYEFLFDVQDSARRLFENILYAWGGRIWALPIWMDVEQLAEELPAASSEILLDPAGRDFHADGLGVVINGAGVYEAFEIDSVESDRIVLSRPLVNNWPMGSRVYPARTARMLDPRSIARSTRNYVRGTARFQTVEEIARSALDEDLYRGLPVMVREPNWRDAPDIDYNRKLAIMDFGTGKDYQVDEADLALPTQSFRWTMLDRDEADYFRAWLYARKGRCQGVWLPTWSDDLILVDTVTPDQLNIDVEYAGLVHFAVGDVHRKDIRVELKNGTIFFRRVINPVAVDATTERMTMNEPFGQQVLVSQVARISWMHYVRLDTDSVELTWSAAHMAEAAIVTRGPRNGF